MDDLEKPLKDSCQDSLVMPSPRDRSDSYLQVAQQGLVAEGKVRKRCNRCGKEGHGIDGSMFPAREVRKEWKPVATLKEQIIVGAGRDVALVLLEVLVGVGRIESGKVNVLASER
ncbi:hypothetical protein Dimus_033040 [Dionaea muscipula]